MSNGDIAKEAKEAFEEAEAHESENRRQAREDVRFGRLDDQWTDDERRNRDLDGRPCLTVNKLPASMRQVYNDTRQNRPAIVVHPVDGGADPDTAEVLNGIIRNIEQSSDAESAYDTALEHAVDRGRGMFKIDLEYAHDDTFEQDIVIKRIANPWSVYGDPASTAVDSSDWDTAFELDTLAAKRFERRFKGAEASSFADTAEVRSDRTGDEVTIAAWWTRETVERAIVALSDGSVVALDDFKAKLAMYQALGVEVVGQPRKVPSYKVTQRLISGVEVLETVEWAGKYIPIIPVYGEEVNEDGKRHFRSLIRGAKDAQRRYNFHISEETEQTGNQTKAPWIGAKGSFITDAKRWATSNENHAYLEYDPVVVTTPAGPMLAPAPMRQPPPMVPAAAIQAAMIASDDMKAIMGIHDASLGANGGETSGRAIMARQREGDISTYHFPDNLNRAIRHAGRVLVNLVPKVYAIPKVQRILGPDGKASMVPVNQAFQQDVEGPNGQVQKISRIYDLTTGRYDVTVKAGPSFTSRREEAATQMIELIRAYPDAAPVIGDLLASNLDWPGADEIADRLKKAQLQGESPDAQQAQAEMQKLAELVKQLQGQLAQAKNDQAAKAREVEIKAFEAETDRMKVQGELALQAKDQQIAELQVLVARLSGGTIQAAA